MAKTPICVTDPNTARVTIFHPGQQFVDRCGVIYTVLGRFGHVVVLQKQGEDRGRNFTLAELKAKGFQIYTAPTVVTKTVADVERELGMAPGSLHITK